MQRRISLQNEARRAPRPGAPKIIDADAGRGAEGLPIAESCLHLRIACARPQSVTLQPDDGSRIAQLRMEGIWRGKEVVGKRVNRGNRYVGRHLANLLLRVSLVDLNNRN